LQRKFNLPDLFLAISLGMIAIEAALGSLSLIKARYRPKDTIASPAMQIGNIAMNLMMAGIVFAGLTAVYKVRLFTISPGSPWAWMVLFVLDDFTYYWFHRISHECRFWWAAHVNHHSSQEYNLSTGARRNRNRVRPAGLARGRLRADVKTNSRGGPCRGGGSRSRRTGRSAKEDSCELNPN
jgi:hypothetical protein